MAKKYTMQAERGRNSHVTTFEVFYESWDRNYGRHGCGREIFFENVANVHARNGGFTVTTESGLELTSIKAAIEQIRDLTGPGCQTQSGAPGGDTRGGAQERPGPRSSNAREGAGRGHRAPNGTNGVASSAARAGSKREDIEGADAGRPRPREAAVRGEEKRRNESAKNTIDATADTDDEDAIDDEIDLVADKNIENGEELVDVVCVVYAPCCNCFHPLNSNQIIFIT